LKNVGSSDAGHEIQAGGRLVTMPPFPSGTNNPAAVTAAIERIIAPGIPRATKRHVSKTPPANKVTSGFEMSPKPTSVAGFATIMPPFSSPIKAMNNPMPAEMAIFIEYGMAARIFSRTPVIERSKNRHPLMKTKPSALCHGMPMPMQTLNAKNALIPIPGASASGKFVSRAINVVAIAALNAVAVTSAASGMPAFFRISGFAARM